MFARIENNIVVEIFEGDLLPDFHPSLIWMASPADVKEGWIYDSAAFVDPKTLITDDDRKSELIDFINKYRQEIDLQEIDVNGAIVKGDDITRSAIIETITFLEKQDGIVMVDWEAENGFVSVDVADLVQIGEAIAYRRQKSFTVKKAISLAIELSEILTQEEAKSAFDIGMTS